MGGAESLKQFGKDLETAGDVDRDVVLSLHRILRMSSRYSLLLCTVKTVNYQEHQLVLHELGRYVQLLRDLRAGFFFLQSRKMQFYSALISLQMNLLMKTEK